MSLALATLIYEWRRYLAAVIALAFSGMMVLAFSGLFAGIIHAELRHLGALARRHHHPAGQREEPGQQQRQPAGAREAADLPAIRTWSTSKRSGGDGAQLVNMPKPGQKQVQTLRADLRRSTRPPAR